jgi:hypothetical protein
MKHKQEDDAEGDMSVLAGQVQSQTFYLRQGPVTLLALAAAGLPPQARATQATFGRVTAAGTFGGSGPPREMVDTLVEKLSWLIIENGAGHLSLLVLPHRLVLSAAEVLEIHRRPTTQEEKTDFEKIHNEEKQH